MNVQSLVRAFVPLPGGATAVYLSSGLAYYRHSDWLVSSRLATTPTQTLYGDVAYAPYGETYAQSGSADFSFTGLNEDVEQNANPATLYDFLAREYGIQGRWPSPDPLGIGAVDPSNPQSWNRYAYVDNNPLAMTDPTGLFLFNGPAAPVAASLCSNPFVCAILIFADIISSFLDFFFGPPTPEAAPAPPGGYGGGIDPYGTWNEKLPKGVQVFPSSITGIPNGSGCTYGSGSCGGVIFSLIDPRNFTNGTFINWTRWAFFAKNFFSKSFYKQELSEHGCLSAFSEGSEAGKILPDLPPGSGVDDAIRQGGQAAAVGYQMTKGLTTPLRSSIYRGILEGAEHGAAVVAAADYYNQAANGLISEVKAIANGSCH